MNINLSKFKTVHKDKDSATLRHSDGHEIKLSLKALSPKSREEIHRLPMAEGGEANNPKLSESKKSPSNHKSLQQLPGHANSAQMGPYGVQPVNKGDKLHDSKNYAVGGTVSKGYDDKPAANYAEGGDVAPTGDESLPINLNFNSSAPPATLENSTPGSNFQAAGFQPATPEPSFLIQPQQETPVASSLVPSAKAPIGEPQSAPSPKAAPTDALPQPQDMAAMQSAGLAKQLGGVEAQGVAQADIIKRQAAVAAGAAKAQSELMAHIQDTTQKHNAEINSVIQDIKNNHIDPSRYMSSLDTAGRIETGIGLILGGIGGGGRGNMALDFLNKQIDRDIAGQVSEQGKKENLVSLYSKMLGNEQAGTTMAANVLANITANKLLSAGAASKSAEAMGRAQQAAGALLSEYAPKMQQLNMQQGLYNMMQSQPGQSGSAPNGQWGPEDDAKQAHILKYMQVVNPEMYKNAEAQYVPGVGVSSRPVPQATRDTLIAKQTLADKAQRLYDWASKHSGSMSLYNPTDVAKGATMAAELQSDYRNSINGGVFKKGEQEFIDNIVDSDPTKFFNSIRVLPKLKEVIDSNALSTNILKKAAGLPVAPMAPEAQEIKQYNGASYRRDPAGHWVKIQK